MEIAFWGVRGSTPAPDREQWRYGGNTPCVAVRPSPAAGGASEQALLILDAGTGIRELGRAWLRRFPGPGLRASLLFTHYHWDHIQGLPFFEPFYHFGNSFRLFGPRPQGRLAASLQEVIEGQFQPPCFPTGADALHATREYTEIGEEQFELDGLRVTTRRLNHPQGCLGYRLEAPGATVVYATDHEPGFPAFDRALIELAWNADLVIADAHFLPDELARHRGWGHSTWAHAVRLARDANARHLILFHHHPARRDAAVDLILAAARREFPATWAAAEQSVFSVADSAVRVTSHARRLSQRHAARRSVILEGQENGLAFAEEAWLENLGFHGAYLVSRHRLDLNSPVRILIQPDSQPSAAPPGPADGKLELEGFVVRSEPVEPGAGEPSEPAPAAAPRFGVAVHFPGRPEPSIPES